MLDYLPRHLHDRFIATREDHGPHNAFSLQSTCLDGSHGPCDWEADKNHKIIQLWDLSHFREMIEVFIEPRLDKTKVVLVFSVFVFSVCLFLSI